MLRRLALCLPLAFGIVSLTACGSDVESDPDLGSGGSGGSGPSSSSSSSGSSTSSTSSGSEDTPTPPECGAETCDPGESCYECPLGGGSPEPNTAFVCSGPPVGTLDGTHLCSPVWSAEPCEDPYDQACNCAACEGSCVQACNFAPEWECHDPPAPTEDQFSCGGWLNCARGVEACIHVTPQGDGCTDYFCSPLPDACTGDVSCDCLAPYIDEQVSGSECTEDDGDLEVLVYGDAHDPPWDQPACGLATCDPGEACWSCLMGGSSETYLACGVDNPDPTHVCDLIWGQPAEESEASEGGP